MVEAGNYQQRTIEVPAEAGGSGSISFLPRKWRGLAARGCNC